MQEVFITEIVVFLLISFSCFGIYFWTKQLYDLSKHYGIRQFRNVFLFFGLGFLFRFVHLLWTLVFDLGHNNVTLLLTGYFGAMAVLSLLFTIYMRKVPTWLAHGFAIVTALVMFFTHSVLLFIVMNAAILVATTIILIMNRRFTSNTITVLLLIIFWICSSFVFYRNLVAVEIKIPMYTVLIILFYSIAYRVYRRIHSGKKAR